MANAPFRLSNFTSKADRKSDSELSSLKVTLTLTPGTLSPTQRAAGEKLWARLISEAKASAGQPVNK